MCRERLDRPLAEHHAQGERHVGAGQLLLHDGGDDEGQALAAMRFGDAQPGPAAFDIKLVGVDKARRQGDDAIIQLGVRLVTDAVQRRKDVRSEFARFGENGVDHVGRRIGVARQCGKAGQIGDAIKHEALFGGGGGVGHISKALG